ncbi:MAG TPA: PQQ-binding-like beta-propeller repeat protein [Chitinophagaceae bacterium]|nr:PQQ-like beta-propeller repeat protein [Chitinophagaceae bacterium]MCC6635427.1 PQQ-binding-like beta-propeller repeat protein [Chitinophagaceae bacterium]HMZ45266.1 PQQ-binding-like beta-propeller repeat protein [Chitinophagaceae bacterium]HNE92655.1 PQQ-binding-like beta-propeller repeat protein [Chitinophagaceae bacterium]HNF28849.1 PQQ-binding-like beta-propeller repeat protein [Chitinophagaceae bacterium]
MKKLLLALVIHCSVVNFSIAQDDMKSVWSIKLEHKAELNEFDEASGILVSSNEKEISIVDATTGKVKWTKDFKTLCDGIMKKVDERIPMWEAKCIFLFDRKSGKDQMAVIDIETGQMLWSSNKYEGVTEASIAYVPEVGMFAIANKKAFSMVKARTGEEVWETQGFKGTLAKYIYNASDNSIIALNYNPAAAGEGILGGMGKLFAGFGAFKSQLTKFSVKNGDILWQTDIKGAVEKEIATRKILAKLKIVDNDKLMLIMQGMQMFDLNNGSLLWGVTHSEEVLKESKRGIPSGYSGSKLVKSAVYGAVADPLIDGNDVYLFDMQNKKNQYVSKYDLHTGKLIWKSKELKKLTIAPSLYKVGGKIIIQIGGWAQVQGIVEQKSNYGGGFGGSGFSVSTYKRVKFYKEFSPYGVEALDATNGELVWRSERFSKGVTNSFVHNGELVVASGKELYNLNPDSGTEKYSESVKDDGIKETEQIFKVGDNVVVVCSKGMSNYVIADGKKNWTVKTKKGDLSTVNNGMAFYITEKNDFVVIDLTTGKYTTYDARKDSDSEIYEDGQYILVFEKDKVTKLATKQ